MSDNESTSAGVPYQTAGVAPVPADISSPPAAAGTGGLLAMLERLATSPNLNIDVFERLLQARRQEEDRVAERAFNAAMSLAKGELSPVLKTNVVDFTTAKGRTKYKYESMADVARAVDPVFAKHGLAYRFSQAQSGDMLTVTCIISHADGYSERNSLQAKVDAGGSSMSSVQALGSVATYLQRYSLRAGIGLAAGLDDDGRGGGSQPRISPEQASQLRKLIQDTNSPTATLLRLVGVEDIDAMTADQFTRAKEVLELRRNEQRAKHAPGD